MIPALSSSRFSRESWIHCKESSGEEVDECPGPPTKLFHVLLSPQQRSLQLWITTMDLQLWIPYSLIHPQQSTYIVQFSSVQSLSHVWLCNHMDCSTPGLPVHHQLPEFIQTHVHWVGDAIQPSHPLSSPSPPAFNLSQHQGLFKGVSSLHQVARVLEFQLQHQPFE